jgi:hypothetical protein
MVSLILGIRITSAIASIQKVKGKHGFSTGFQIYGVPPNRQKSYELWVEAFIVLRFTFIVKTAQNTSVRTLIGFAEPTFRRTKRLL